MLAFRQNYPVIDFRQVAENEAKEKLLELASGYLKIEQSESTSKKGDLNRTDSRKKKKQESTDKKDNLSFQVIFFSVRVMFRKMVAKLKRKTGNMPKRQQPNQKAENSPRPTKGTQHS